ncbi:MAG: hypothetical protein HOC71_08290 [Candidatus Latescibacteria bacterium]|jgi:hypothetical protein|nr:hypothetical protein [Candidatus Latescibacterota bacterium]
MGEDKRIVIAAEDILSIEVAKKLLEENGHFIVINERNTQGSGDLKKNIRAYHKMAYHGILSIVITDLDKGNCAPELIHDWLGMEPHIKFLFRVAVKEIEAWLLADRKGIAKFLGVRINKITHYPEELDDPKLELINLARSGKKLIKEELIPSQGSTAQIGEGYNATLTKFIHSFWNTDRARECSRSLCRTIKKIECL